MSVTTAVGLDFMVNSITGQADLQRAIQQATAGGAAKGLGGAIEDTQRQLEAKYGRAYVNALKIGAKQEADNLEQHFKQRQQKIAAEVAELQKANQKLQSLKDRADDHAGKVYWRKRKKAIEDGIRMEQQAQEKLIQQREDSQAKMVDLFDRGMQRAADNLESRTEKIGNAFASTIEGVFSGQSIDPAQLMRSAGGGLKEAAPGLMAHGGKMAGSSSKVVAMLGKGAMALGAAAGAIAGVAAALASVVAVMSMAYGRSKDMNKSIMESAAAFDLVGTSGKHLGESLTSVRKATQSVALRYRQTTDEIQSLLSAMNDAGLTYREMGDYANFATNDMMAFTSVARQALVAATNFGVGNNEIAEFTNRMYRDQSQNFLGVDEALQGIFGSAQLANMSMRGFFTSINEATSSMALMNFRMEDTAELLIAMTDILGEDMGKEMAKFSGRFRDMGHTDRMRSVLTGGRAGRQVLGAASDRQTANFLSSLQSAAGGGATLQILKSQGLLKDGKLDVSGLRGGQLGRVQELIAQQGDEGSAIRLGKLARMQRGTRSGASLGQQATALGQVGDLGELAFGFVEASAALGNMQLGDMENLDRAAYENITGRSGGELEAMMDISNRMAARIATDRGVGVETITSEDIAMAIASGEMHLSPTDKEALEKAREASMPEMEKLARQQLVETTSISQTLKNKIGGLLEQTYSLISFWAGDDTSEQVEVMKAAREAFDEARESSANAATALEEFDPSAFAAKLRAEGIEVPQEEMMAAAATLGPNALSSEVFDAVIAKRTVDEERRLAAEKVQADKTLLQKEAGYGAALGTGTGMSVVLAEAKALADYIEAGGGSSMLQEDTALAGQLTTSSSPVQQAMGEVLAENLPQNIDPNATYTKPIPDGFLPLMGGVVDYLSGGRLGPTFFGTETGAEKLDRLGYTDDMKKVDEANTDALIKAGGKDSKTQTKAITGTLEEVLEAIRKGDEATILGNLAAATGRRVGDVGKLSKGDLLAAVAGKDLTPEQKAALQVRLGQLEQGVDDFIYRGGANGGIITPIDSQDSFFGAKPGGAIDQAIGGRGGVVNNFYINGNNPQQIVSVVRRAMAAATGRKA